MGEVENFEDDTEEYVHHLGKSQWHAQRALDLLYKSNGPRRSLWCRMLIGRAQSILISLYCQELRNRKRNS